MHPELLRIGPVTMYSYGLMVAFGILAASLVVQYLATRRSLPAGPLIDVVFWIVIAGLVGARGTYVMLHLDEFRSSAMAVFKLQQGGLVFQGGLALGILAAAVFLRRYKLALWPSLDILSVGVPLAHALGRIGCFLNGCCYGRPYTGLLAVRFPGHLRYVHPTMLYESAALVGLFVILFRTEQRSRFSGQVTAWYLVGYGSIRFCIEFLRGDPRLMIGPLSLFQLVSIVMILSGIFIYRKRRANNHA